MLIYNKLHEKSYCCLLIIYMKNTPQKVKTDEILAACAHYFVICTCVTTLHSCYMKNALVFSQSDARKFFMYFIAIIIIIIITIVIIVINILKKKLLMPSIRLLMEMLANCSQISG